MFHQVTNFLRLFFVDYGTLSQKELIAEVKRLYDIAYNLGVEEAKEMTRGKYLHILQKKKSQ